MEQVVGSPVNFTEPSPTGTERYALKRLLAHGGLGQVWLAYDRQLQRDVAYKQVLGKWASTPHVVEQLRQEAIVTGQLEHPGVVPVHDVGFDEHEQLFYCMKLVQGNTLREALDYWSTMKPGLARDDQRRRIFAAFVAVCDAMAYAHSRGVLHLDLKPENVILGDYGETQILDWGLAKLLSGSAFSPDGRSMKGVVGTPRYMAPEQIAGNEAGLCPVTDVYSLGVMLAEMALLDNGMELPRLEKGKLRESPAQVRAAIRRLRGPIRSICRRATAESPADRYQDARELAVEVQRYLAGEKVHAHREGLFAKFRRFANRQKTYVTAAAVTLIVFAGWWLDRRINQESDQRAARIAHDQAIAAWQQGQPERALDSLRAAADRLARHGSETDEAKAISEEMELLTSWCAFDVALREARLLSGDSLQKAKAIQSIERAKKAGGVQLSAAYVTPALLAERKASLAELTLLEAWLSHSEDETPTLPVDHDSKSYLIGRYHQLAGRTIEAARAFENRLAENPGDFWAMYFLATCHEKLGQPELALVGYTGCLAQEPKLAFLYVNRGNVLQNLGRRAEALQDYERADRLAAEDAMPAFNRGVLLANASQWPEAIKEFDDALRKSPDHVEALVHRARAYRVLRQFDAAQKDLQLALALDPSSATAHAGMAFLFRDRGKPDEAQAAADKASSLDSRLATSAWIAGLLASDRQDWKSADEAFARAIQVEPENVSLRSNRADALLSLGNPAAALSELDVALTLDPDFQMARWNRIRCLLQLAKADDVLRNLELIALPQSELDAFEQAQRYANSCLNASQVFDPAKARPIVNHCLTRIAELTSTRDPSFHARLEQTPSVARLARNPQTRERMFGQPASN